MLLRFAEARGDFGSFRILSASHSDFLGAFAFFFAGVLFFGRSGIDFVSSLDGDPKRWGAVTLRRGRTGVNGDSISDPSEESVDEDGISVFIGSGFVSGSADAESAVDIVWFGPR